MDMAKILQSIPENVRDPEWINNHLEELHAVIENRLKKKIGWREVVQVLLYVMPAIIDRPEAKQWGRLVEQAYEQSPYAEIDGLDGVQTIEEAGFFSITKREKKLQLPTKTTRRKRLIIHPTQTLEIHIILFMAFYYRQAQNITQHQIDSLIYYGRIVNDPYISHKIHLALAFLYTNRYEPEMALPHAEVAYRYWEKRDDFDTGLSAYIRALSLQNLGQLREAMICDNIAADKLAKTDHKSQYGAVALLKASLHLHMDENKEAIHWAKLGIENFKQINSAIYVAHGETMLGIAQARLDQVDNALKSLQRATEAWAQADSPPVSLTSSIALATVQGYAGNHEAAHELLNTVQEKINGIGSGDMQTIFGQAVQTLREMLDSGQVTLDNILPKLTLQRKATP
jgi:tetratricopeptide (TPR) repeat protein